MCTLTYGRGGGESLAKVGQPIMLSMSGAVPATDSTDSEADVSYTTF